MSKQAPEHLCHAYVSRHGYLGDCSRAGVNEDAGGWWCKQHTPSAVQARRDAADAKWRERKRAEAVAQLTEKRLEAIRIADAYIEWLGTTPGAFATHAAFAEWLYPEVPE